MLAIVQLGQKGPPEILQNAISRPELEAVVDRAFLAIPSWQFFPRSAGPENPEDAFEAFAVVRRRTPALGMGFAFGKVFANLFPLLVGKFAPGHATCSFESRCPRR
jgi:hypothetical protein